MMHCTAFDVSRPLETLFQMLDSATATQFLLQSRRVDNKALKIESVWDNQPFWEVLIVDQGKKQTN